jgi:cytochrome c oxidase cbb3-type subunit II
MEKPSTLFTGIFAAFIVSTGAMLLLPAKQLSGLQPQVTWDEGALFPADRYPVDTTQVGRDTYMANGCYYCHTQQVRDPQYGPDIDRGWGVRRTVARDFIFENTPLLGTRLGPDFSNYGWVDAESKQALWRNEPVNDPAKPAKRDAKWIYQHLYNPRILKTHSNSNCPPMRHWFVSKDIGAEPSPDAVAIENGKQVVPGDEARKIAQYLLSLNRSKPLKEAPVAAKEEKK